MIEHKSPYKSLAVEPTSLVMPKNGATLTLGIFVAIGLLATSEPSIKKATEVAPALIVIVYLC